MKLETIWKGSEVLWAKTWGPDFQSPPRKGGSQHCLLPGEGRLPWIYGKFICLICVGICRKHYQPLGGSPRLVHICFCLPLVTSLQRRRKSNNRVVRCPGTCDRRNSNQPAFPLHSTLRLHEIKSDHNRVVLFVYVLENDILKGQLQAVPTLSKLVFAMELLMIEGQLLTKRPWNS